MGAGCSNRSAARVQDSIVKGGDVNALSAEAQEHLKMLQAQNPGAKGAASMSTDQLKKLGQGSNEKAGVGEDADVADKDINSDAIHRAKHSELWDAVEVNDTDEVAQYLEQYEEKTGEELKENELYDHMGNSMIHKAASLGHAEALMLLLERTGAKPDIPNASLATPLHLACKNNRLDAAKFLIGCGVDANAQDEHGQMPLLICCIHGHYDLAKMLIDASISGHLPEPLECDQRDHRGLSPLNCAAIKGDFDMTRLLAINARASVDGQSPKGCTPLLYAARGGYAEVVRFLLVKGASPLRQDNAGGTVLHHAIEKGHLNVLHVLQEHGVDMLSAIEIPDNAGRTPVFEAIDNHDDPELLRMLTRSHKENGFEAKVNITNYNGQTPLFSAAREGNLEVIKCLVEDCHAKVDLTQGELFKEEYDDGDSHYDSLEEKFFMDAYKNSMTPLHVAVILGHEEVMLYLIKHGANPNLQTKIKGYSCLHLAVLANKPEIVIELLTKTQANPYLPDFGGRTLQDMVEIFIPSYLESFKALLENLQALKLKGLEEQSTSQPQQEESLMGLAQRTVDEGVEQPVVATHYYNPDDERSLQGVGADENKIKELYHSKADGEQADANKENDTDAINTMGNEQKQEDKKKFSELEEAEIEVEIDSKVDAEVAKVFGSKIARALIALDWKYKEHALKLMYKNAEKLLDMQNHKKQNFTLQELTSACISAVSLTCKEKVIKVFIVSLQLMNLVVSSQKVEREGAAEVLKNTIVEKNVVLKLLQKSEEGNTRMTNKIHESLLDLSFNPEIGEALASSFILQRIQAHNRANMQKLAQKNHVQGNDESRMVEQTEKIETETSLGSYKGLLAQLALLYKFINSFGIASKTRGPLSVKDILKSVIPSVQHPNQDVRNAAGKILIDVQKFSGCVTEEELSSVNEKARNALMEKIKKVAVEKNLEDTNARVQAHKHATVQSIKEEDGDETDRAEVPETISTSSPSKGESKRKELADLKTIIEEKGSKKDWQERELALKAMEEVFQERPAKQQFDLKDLLEEQFLQSCLILLKTCLEENNMALYLQAVEVASSFFMHALDSEIVHGSLQSLITSILLRTTDTNTRVRKRSVDLINQVWDHKPGQGLRGGPTADKLMFNTRDSLDNQTTESRTDPMCQVIAQVICEPQHGEKAIVGRLGLFIKRASLIEGGKDLVNKPLQIVLGQNYEQLTEFACQWVSHKNTKVRQNALRLIVEVCRINCMDPRGQPFKQRIVNYILGLRASQRDPLVQKINEVCKKHLAANKPPGNVDQAGPFINVSEMELTVATKGRAASVDHVGAKRRLQSASRGSKRGENTRGDALLPQIGGVAQLAGDAGQGLGPNQPTIVLPHSEPLTEEQKQQHHMLLELFGLQIMTCFLSKSWATRMSAIQKIAEQIHNLDPHRRDAMSAEINRQNMPPELTFKTFLELMTEGIKDPVLKNYIELLELFQRALPTFFRYIKPPMIQEDIKDIIKGVLRKTADMKQKIRESSANFCLYLSHQSPVGPEYMIKTVLEELADVQSEKLEMPQPSAAAGPPKKQNNVATTFGNSHMIVSCLSLLNEYQNQSKILELESLGQCEELLGKFMAQINLALRHQNPQVRKEAEKLFRTLYQEFGQPLEARLVNQKPQLQQKLIESAKLEAVQNSTKRLSSKGFSQKPQKALQSMSQEQKVELDIQRAHEQIRDQAINLTQLNNVIEGAEEHLQALKLPNPKKRQKAVVEIKKAISKKIVAEMTPEKARELFEPFLMLMRQLLQDNDADIYLESLNLLKYIVGSLSPHLSTLDLHLMLGSFIGLIVHNSFNTNIRIQVQTDKVIIFFAKHQSIGPVIVAKEITKSIGKLNSSIQSAAATKLQDALHEKHQALLRFYGILQLLLQQFSIVLCYQQEFYAKCLECLADTLLLTNSVQGGGAAQGQEGHVVAVAGTCTQLIYHLYAADYKLLDQSVGKLDSINRKTPLRKAIIEHETQQRQGKSILDVGKQLSAPVGAGEHQTPQQSSHHSTANLNQTIDPMRETQMSFASSTRQSLFSPGSTATRGMSPGGFGQSQYGGENGWGRTRLDSQAKQSQLGEDSLQPTTQTRRMMSLGDGARRRHPGTNQSQSDEQYLANHPVSTLTQNNWRRQQDVLPALPGGAPSTNLSRTGVLLPKIGAGGLDPTSYQFEAKQRSPEKKTQSQAADHAKFKLKSTGGAGFSSGQVSSQLGTSISNYEPSSASRRTPRRTLGVIMNSNNSGIANIGSSLLPKPSQGVESSTAGGVGGAANIQWPSQAGQNMKTMESTIGSSTGFAQASQGGKSGAVKPPLYIPSRRDSSNNNRRSTDRRPAHATMGGAAAADGYVSKTGFSSLNLGTTSSSTDPAPARTSDKTNQEKIPYEQPVPNQRRSNSKPAAATSLFSGFGANAPMAASTQIKGFTND